MSQRSVEQALGKMVTDEVFRREFFRDPDRARPEVSALQRVPRVMLAQLGASLEDRICRLAIPEGTQEAHS
jgi:hypothetical protein